MAIYVLNQLKNDSYCQPLYNVHVNKYRKSQTTQKKIFKKNPELKEKQPFQFKGHKFSKATLFSCLPKNEHNISSLEASAEAKKDFVRFSEEMRTR